jgi:hypothetical protein
MPLMVQNWVRMEPPLPPDLLLQMYVDRSAVVMRVCVLGIPCLARARARSLSLSHTHADAHAKVCFVLHVPSVSLGVPCLALLSLTSMCSLTRMCSLKGIYSLTIMGSLTGMCSLTRMFLCSRRHARPQQMSVKQANCRPRSYKEIY